MRNLTLSDKIQAASWGDLYGEKATEAQASTSDIEITVRGETTPPTPPEPQPPQPKPQR